MNSKYNDLFDELISSYYHGNFDETLNKIMVCHEKSPQETFEIITSLCGVTLKFDNDYLHKLKKAITDYTLNKSIVKKLECCNEKCDKDSDNKFKCQASCPFDAILYDEHDKSTYIDQSICVNCGVCVDSCKHGKILDKVEFMPIMNLIQENDIVIAAVAPSIIGQFGEDVSMDMLRTAFMKIGFTDMIEVAFAADVLTVKEAVEFDKHVNKPGDLMITSCCCPMWVGMLRKVYNELIPDLSPSVSPMVAAGRIIKTLNKNAKVVFIGPCIAKKAEAMQSDVCDAIDFVLTFQEVSEIFNALNIDPSKLTPMPSLEYASRCGRLYARSGGVSTAIGETIKDLYPEKFKNFKAVKASGVAECKELLNKALNKTIDANFIEGMGCKGGCVGGPKRIIPVDKGTEAANKFAYDSPIKVPIYSDCLNELLQKLNINSVEDFEDPDKVKLFEREF